MRIKFGLLIILCSCAISSFAVEIGLNSRVFDILDLERDGLSKVKMLHNSGDDSAAAIELLHYYRDRFSNGKEVATKPSSLDSLMAVEALEHKLYVHDGYQPSFFYGDDINWDYWPVKDDELRWQLHRHKWFSSMGRMYRWSGDERYAKEWTLQYMDWVEKNPNTDDLATSSYTPAADNAQYSWRPLEVSHRLRDQCAQFEYFLFSDNFTPEFLSQFLVNYHKQAENLMGRFNSGGNHLILQSERILYGGSFFKEFKNADKWCDVAIDNLNREIALQVYDDGFHFEQCPHYHRLCASVFTRVLVNSQKGGYSEKLPASFSETIKNMYEAYYNIMFPDYTIPLFSDNRQKSKQEELNYFKAWSSAFAGDKQLEFFKTEGASGEKPAYNSKGLLTSGFFTFRTGWDYNDTVMVVKAGLKPGWHAQPDNGTFDLYINGRNFMPDGGCYVYGGDEEILAWRNWFKKSSTHKTLTLDNRDYDRADSKTLLWDIDGDTETLVTEVQCYKDLKHRRSILFVDRKFFVVVDQAIGSAKGDIAIHYQFEPTATITVKNDSQIYTNYNDKNNILIQTTASKKFYILDEEGWISYTYQKKEQRPAFGLNMEKVDENPLHFISVILPVEDGGSAPKIKTEIKSIDDNQLSLVVKVGKKSYKCRYSL